MRFVTVPLAFAAFGLVVMTLTTQAQPSQKPKRPPRFEVNVDAVTLDVVVTDKKGRFVKGLKQEDFAVLEEGIPQELEFFTAENTPVTVWFCSIARRAYGLVWRSFKNPQTGSWTSCDAEIKLVSVCFMSALSSAPDLRTTWMSTSP